MYSFIGNKVFCELQKCSIGVRYSSVNTYGSVYAIESELSVLPKLRLAHHDETVSPFWTHFTDLDSPNICCRFL